MNSSTAPRYDPYVRDCPSRLLLDRIGGRWTVLVLGVLEAGPLRYGTIAERVEGISQKMLTQTLRSLERDELVLRTSYPEVPPRVEYELTETGRSLREPLAALERWAVEHMPTIRQANERWEAAHPGAA